MLPNDTPGIEEGGSRQDIKNTLRNAWRKQIESEERLGFLKKMVGMNIGVREVEHLSEDIVEKYRSEKMKGGRSDREVVKMIMNLKLKDERGHQRELKKEKNRVREKFGSEIADKKLFRIEMSAMNKEDKLWRKTERIKFT